MGHQLAPCGGRGSSGRILASVPALQLSTGALGVCHAPQQSTSWSLSFSSLKGDHTEIVQGWLRFPLLKLRPEVPALSTFCSCSPRRIFRNVPMSGLHLKSFWFGQKGHISGDAAALSRDLRARSFRPGFVAAQAVCVSLASAWVCPGSATACCVTWDCSRHCPEPWLPHLTRRWREPLTQGCGEFEPGAWSKAWPGFTKQTKATWLGSQSLLSKQLAEPVWLLSELLGCREVPSDDPSLWVLLPWPLGVDEEKAGPCANLLGTESAGHRICDSPPTPEPGLAPCCVTASVFGARGSRRESCTSGRLGWGQGWPLLVAVGWEGDTVEPGPWTQPDLLCERLHLAIRDLEVTPLSNCTTAATWKIFARPQRGVSETPRPSSSENCFPDVLALWLRKQFREGLFCADV